MIRLEDVAISYGRTTILKDISMETSEGEIVTIIGGSGCGKSTLLRAVMGLIKISGGKIFIEGARTDNLNERRMNTIRKGMGMVFQEGALFDSMNVRENVAFALRRHTKMTEKKIRETVTDRLEAVELDGVDEKFPSELSGGMRRRVGIARALALHPRILLYDEPTTGLDPILTAKVTALILKMRDRYNTTSVVVTHDMGVVERAGGQVFMIHNGGFIARGMLSELRKSGNEHVRDFIGAMKIPCGAEQEERND